MATLILSAVGTAVGGPVGGAVGALLGRAVDSTLIGTPLREGSRLTELAVTTSSYGQPIPRVYGTMRLPGSIIWATDLIENSETTGGKGKPKTTSYSYAMSFAVALSSRPIASLGRVWADGALLRGSGGDLKVGGTMRLHAGHDDQPPDPLIVADRGAHACAFRGLAYAVFEDLDLASFGNRIPALSFEIHAPDGSLDIVDFTADVALTACSTVPLTGLSGFADHGGTRTDLLSRLARVYPFAALATPDGPELAMHGSDRPSVLPPAVAGRADGENHAAPRVRRKPAAHDAPSALRYYDPARDFQPSLQHAPGIAHWQSAVVEFPGVFAAADARSLIDKLRRVALSASETLSCRIAALTPEHTPGRYVTRARDDDTWLIRSADWHADGVDLALERVATSSSRAFSADPGNASPPVDELPGRLEIAYFELPWDGSGPSTISQRYVAASLAGSRSRIAVFGMEDDSLVPLGLSARGDALVGRSLEPLGPSPALVFETAATLDIALPPVADGLQSVTERALLDGANRLLLGEEVLQFRFAEPLGGGAWRLYGLLRGRGGTEHLAATGHEAGAIAILLDERLLPIGPVDCQEICARSGLASVAPACATLVAPGTTLRPLCPVHPALETTGSGDPQWHWVRRARGAWRWSDAVDAPLVEEREAYRIGFGPVNSPHATWEVSAPGFSLPAAQWSALKTAFPGAPLWAAQIGTHAQSIPLLLPR